MKTNLIWGLIAMVGLIGNLFLYNTPAYIPGISEVGIAAGIVSFSVFIVFFFRDLFKKI